MQISKIPVEFANRAEMIECEKHAFSVCANIPENRVYVNLYVEGKTRVIGMTEDEARDLAQTLEKGANDLRSRTEDREYMRALEAQQKREALEKTDKVFIVGSVQGTMLYNVETSDSGIYQVFKGRVWKILHAGKLRELNWKRNEREITRACGAVARYEAEPSDAEHIRAIQAQQRHDRQENGE